jgi:hypothetical protein
MAKKSYVTNLVMILGVSTVLLVFIFILVAHHREVPDKVRLDRGVLLAGGSSVAERIKPVGEVAGVAGAAAGAGAERGCADAGGARRAADLARRAASPATMPESRARRNWATRASGPSALPRAAMRSTPVPSTGCRAAGG